MDIPEGAKRPDDHQVAAVRPAEHPEGWDLLRPPIDLEFWEVTDFTSLVMSIPSRGEKIVLDAAGLRAIGIVVKTMQEVFAKDSTKFRDWLRAAGDFTQTAERVLPLIFAYAGELGEALGSEK